MFTGLITDVGTIDAAASTDAGREFRIRSRYPDVVAGESVAVNGACLTVRERHDDWFSVAAVSTTAGRTTVGEWAVGRRVNLERALATGGRFGGHLVQGHVDAVAEVTRTAPHGDALLVDLLMPAQLMPLVVPLGSICVDGVSLTVNAIHDAQTVQLSLIEFTVRHTTLGGLRAGDRVNVESDILAKYVQRLMTANASLFSIPSSV
ncbi:MAG TPA: riboflavin synthase [Gemmatimonadaceae bacterium]|nr:riboflavin synthase [Gemmatimonadaceae bacterium]